MHAQVHMAYFSTENKGKKRGNTLNGRHKKRKEKKKGEREKDSRRRRLTWAEARVGS